MTAFPPRFFLTPADIDAVMTDFYTAVRADPVLAPVFAAHVTDWPAHEEKVARFWRNAILREGVYDGRPMAVHRMAEDVAPEHFPLWLSAFRASLDRTLPPEKAASWYAMAEKIGSAFRMGVEDARCPMGAIPRLR